MPVRKKLRDEIRKRYGTQDLCAFKLYIDNSALSRIINCTKNPTAQQRETLCKYLRLTPEEFDEKT